MFCFSHSRWHRRRRRRHGGDDGLPIFLAALAVLLVVPALVFAASSSADNVASRVVDASDHDLDALSLGHEALIELYAPWCFACLRFARVYELLAERLAIDLPGLRVFRVDITVNRGAVLRFFPSSVPALYHISKDRLVRELHASLEIDAVSKALRPEALQLIVPWAAWCSPYSLFGLWRGHIGRGAGFILDVLAILRNSPYAQIYAATFAAIFLGLAVCFCTRAPSKRNVTVAAASRPRSPIAAVTAEPINTMLANETQEEQEIHPERRPKPRRTRSTAGRGTRSDPIDSEISDQIPVTAEQRTAPPSTPLRRSTRISRGNNA